MSIDQQFVEYVVKTIVGNPDAVSIKRTIDEKGVLLELTVDPEDLGRVIGKRGSGAQALRTLLRALGTKNDARYNLKIVDVGDERPVRAENHADEERADAPSPQPIEKKSSTEEIAASEEKVQDDAAFADEEEADESSSNLEKTRRELADLDDLDI